MRLVPDSLTDSSATCLHADLPGNGSPVERMQSSEIHLVYVDRGKNVQVFILGSRKRRLSPLLSGLDFTTVESS